MNVCNDSCLGGASDLAMAPKKKGKGGEKASRPVTPPAASVPTSAPPSSAPASAPSSHISPDNTAPISSSSSLQTDTDQTELEFELQNALLTYPHWRLKGMHRHFILFGLMEYLERRFTCPNLLLGREWPLSFNILCCWVDCMYC